MSKRPPFNPDVLERNKPSQSLKPFDFMKPMEEAPALDKVAEAETPPPPVEPSTAPAATVRTPGRESVREAVAASATERSLYLPPVDTREKPFNRGFHMYPSRHEQLLELAHYEQRKPWEIVEQALAEYVKRRYGGKTGK